MHVAVVEVVAVDAPGLGKDLLPFGARIDADLDPVGGEAPRADLDSGAGVDDGEGLTAGDQQLLGVRGDGASMMIASLSAWG